jgi:dual specificity protein kinase YAK1
MKVIYTRYTTDLYHVLFIYREKVTLYDAFQHLEHLCLVFECLSMNLYQYLKKTVRIHNNSEGGFHGVSLNLVKIFARQLLMVSAV